jgi:hypothetical protein
MRSARGTRPDSRGDSGSIDTGSIDTGWLTKVVVVLLVLGVGAVDGVSVVSTRLSVSDDAASAAIAARDSYAGRHDVVIAYRAATDAAQGLHPGTRLPPASFLVAADGAVTVTATRMPDTLVAHYLPWVRDHLEQRATERALPAT